METLSSKRRKGFTLVEMLVVIVIIGILAGLLLPVITHILHQAKVATCAHNLGQLHKTMGILLVKTRGKYPTEVGEDFWLKLHAMTPPLIRERHKEVFFCPVKGEFGAVDPIDYRGPASFAGRYEADDPIGADKEENHGYEAGGNVLLMDGSVREVLLDDELWAACRTKLAP